MKNLKFTILLVLLTSCWTYNKPKNQTPNENVPPNVAKIFVDKNGDFYPENWGSLSYYPLRAQGNNNVGSILTNAESNVLMNIKEQSADKEKIFILVHGYNNDEFDAKKNYKKIQEMVMNDSDKNLFTEFHWDGLVSKNLGSAKIWFNAVGYSQMAGQFGLRKVLNQIHDKDVYLISHSRGASVILSALSNPPYQEKFASDTNKFYNVDVWKADPLLENGNRITTILLAPAVGEIDFTVPNDHHAYRQFTNQLKVIHFTVNNSDKTLDKYIGMQNILNPTTLGSNDKAYLKLKPY